MSVEGLSTGYGETTIVQDINLYLEKGETMLLLGPNGAGKTTIMRTIAGLLGIKKGDVKLHLSDETISLKNMTPQEIIRKGVTFISEDRALFRDMTIEENLKIGSYTARDGVEENLRTVYDLFPRLEERANQIAGTLSGGESKMLSLGIGLMTDPDILLLDEPSLGLAPNLVTQTMEKIGKMKEEYNLSIILAEQNFSKSSKIGDRGYFVLDGKIAKKGIIDDLKDSEEIKKYYLSQ